jgi:ABC-type transport system involved in multi-copper enzyme maturation permease subunit
MRGLKPWMVVAASATLGFLVVLAFDRGVLPFFIYVFLYVVGAVVFSPLQLSTMIAGERESRSLELVLAAPVTSREILSGKVLRALPVNIGLLMVSVTAVLTNLLLSLFPNNSGLAVDSPEWTFWLAVLTTGSVAAVAAHAVVVWISTRTRTRTAAALGSLVGLLGFHTFPFLLLGLVTAFGSSGSISDDQWNVGMQLMYLSPFSHFGLDPDTQGLWVYVGVAWAFWIGLTVLAWISSVRTLEGLRRRGIEN